MKVRVDASGLRHSRWYGHVLRFVLGGGISAVAGWVAKAWGPGVGGLLLAFPAILPAALILLDRSQNEQAPPPARGVRGRHAVVLAAAGAAMGSVGLFVFALVAWAALGSVPAPLALGAATLAWAGVAVLVWTARKHMAHSPYVPRLVARHFSRRNP